MIIDSGLRFWVTLYIVSWPLPRIILDEFRLQTGTNVYIDRYKPVILDNSNFMNYKLQYIRYLEICPVPTLMHNSVHVFKLL